MRRARWRATTTSCSRTSGDGQDRDLHRAASPGHDHRGVVAAAREIPIEHAGHQAGVALEEPGIGGEIEPRRDPVRVHHEHRLLGPGVRVFLDPPRVLAGGAVLRHQVPDRRRRAGIARRCCRARRSERACGRHRCAPRRRPRPRVARRAGIERLHARDRQSAGRCLEDPHRLARGHRRVRAVAQPVDDEHRGSCRAAAPRSRRRRTRLARRRHRDAPDLKAAIDRRPAARARSRSAPPRRPWAVTTRRTHWTGAAPRPARCPGCLPWSSRPPGSGRCWPCPGHGRARTPPPRRPAPPPAAARPRRRRRA